ncbi:MAG: two-component system response regulator [Armatimonadota bacterium]
MADHPNLAQATAAIRAGAYEYLPKPIDPDLLATIKSALKPAAKGKAKGSTASRPFVAESPAMKEIVRQIEQVAPSRATVMVLGESGVGKEVVARAIHAASPRHQKAFSPISCAAIPETLLESELFGYERGAFTGADGVKPGRFEAASGGTLFLDEVGEIPLAVQAKLLRVVQEREIERLGSLGRIPIDVRLIAATHRNLAARVAEGMFRLDLFFRLQIVEIWVPPLRERREDILPLAEHALARFAAENGRAPLRISPSVARRLEAHDWPGNVRELENAMERATVLAPPQATEMGELFQSSPRRAA